MERFLRAKHWQIFMITFGLPIIIEFNAKLFMISDSNSIEIIEIMMLIMMFFFIGGLLGWLWSVATGLQFKVPTGIKMKVKKFKVFFFIPLIYIILIMVFKGLVFGVIFKNSQQPSDSLIDGSEGIFYFLHLFSLFCIFYCIYFVSKTFKTVELQREVTFFELAGAFLMICFFPIGVWIFQPKINKMIENKE